MFSAKNNSDHAATKNLKRKRSFDETEENPRNSMQPARRRYKRADESTTWKDQIVPLVESSDVRSSKSSSDSKYNSRGSSHEIRERYHGNEKKSPERRIQNSPSDMRKIISEKPLIRILTPKEINCSSSLSNESCNRAGNDEYIMGENRRRCSSPREGSKASKADISNKESSTTSCENSRTTSSKVESTSRRSSERALGSRAIGVFSVIKKILDENKRNDEMSAEKQRLSRERENGECSNNESTSGRRSSSPSRSERLCGTSIVENKDPDRHKELNSSRKGNRTSDSNISPKPKELHPWESTEECWDTPPASSRKSSSKKEIQPSETRKECWDTPVNSRTSSLNQKEIQPWESTEECWDTPVSSRKSSSKKEIQPLETRKESCDTPVNSRTSSLNQKEIQPWESTEECWDTPVNSRTSSSKVVSSTESSSESKRSSGDSQVRKGRDEKRSSRTSSSKRHSSNSRSRDRTKHSSQKSPSRRNYHSPSKSKRSIVPRKEHEDVDECRELDSSGNGSIVFNFVASSKPEETNILHFNEESSEAPCKTTPLMIKSPLVNHHHQDSDSSVELITSNYKELPPNREEPLWRKCIAPKPLDECSLSWDSEKRRSIRRTPDRHPSSHSKRREIYTKTVTYKNRYFSPSNSKRSYSTPRRDKISPRKHKFPSSTPRKGNKDSYDLATPWVADFLSSKEGGSETPRARPKVSSEKSTRGPMLESYQLLGDSLMVRFADQILEDPAVIGDNGKYCNGLCVSGQTIDGLIEKVLNSKQPLEPKVIVMIGTNDFLKGSCFTEVKRCMLKLMDILEKSVSEIILLTVPPIPRIRSSSFWLDWERYNVWMKSFNNGKTISVLDLSRFYLKTTGEPDLTYFESHMGYGRKRRTDLIHLNKNGLKRLHREIHRHINKLKDGWR